MAVCLDQTEIAVKRNVQRKCRAGKPNFIITRSPDTVPNFCDSLSVSAGQDMESGYSDVSDDVRRLLLADYLCISIDFLKKLSSYS